MSSRLLRLWRDWAAPVVFALLFTQFGASSVGVDGSSMMPALRHGERLLLPTAEGWAHRLGLGEYHRGDIVVFKPPPEAKYEWRGDYRGMPLLWRYRPYLVKRVVGVPGDTVSIRAGQVSVNGQPLPEAETHEYWNTFCPDTSSSLANSVAASPTSMDVSSVRVPPHHYFVMGDNRSPGGSLDSRAFGPVRGQDISARAMASVWPLVRKVMATPPCDGGPQPEQRVKFSGQEEWNPRLLLP
ncbi:signal peptidase I [Deinococcus sp. AJ005]|uniref:signal peptidase I n=1 Tax=Deinococcus sp. AJ005 TaxID=2652443 RepID=UPI00125CB131|nr:signal peptidase I [Deinococcus sp. AJ005]QFP76172.1 signal peptidase I [Deinococcus sp. AJ005]